MNLDYLVSGGDKYQVFITIGSVPVYMFLTASAVGRNLSQDATPIGAISTEKPIAVKRGIKNNAFNISLQDIAYQILYIGLVFADNVELRKPTQLQIIIKGSSSECLFFGAHSFRIHLLHHTILIKGEWI